MAFWTLNYALEVRISPSQDFAMRIGQKMQKIGDPPRGTCLLLALESFCGNTKNNQPLHYLRQRRSTWSLAIARRKRFDLGNIG